MNEIRKKELLHRLYRIQGIKTLKNIYKKLFRKSQDAFDDVKVKYDLEAIKDFSLESADKVVMKWPEGLKKPFVGLVQENNLPGAYWPKYERFLRNNDIDYDYYDVDKSDFIESASRFDIILWRTQNNPSKQEEAASKIKILESYMGKLCHPSEDCLWVYENKVNQYYLGQMRKLPMIKTFISSSEQETMDFLDNCRYPIVSKITAGSGSEGVKLVKNRSQARKICRKIFGNGLTTCWSYLKQKDYVYFQEFIKDAKYDLRIIVVGDSYFGYYREVPKDDFRASGANKEKFSSLPKEALFLAQSVKESYPECPVLAVDMLKDNRDNKYYIIETSIFPGIDFPSETIVEDRVGRYIYSEGEFHFEEGRYWVQELALEELMKIWISRSKKS